MKLIITADISGTRDGDDWPKRGEEIDVPEEEGLNLLLTGLARPAGESVELAVAPPAEVSDGLKTADVPAPKRTRAPSKKG